VTRLPATGFARQRLSPPSRSRRIVGFAFRIAHHAMRRSPRLDRSLSPRGLRRAATPVTTRPTSATHKLFCQRRAPYLGTLRPALPRGSGTVVSTTTARFGGLADLIRHFLRMSPARRASDVLCSTRAASDRNEPRASLWHEQPATFETPRERSSSRGSAVDAFAPSLASRDGRRIDRTSRSRSAEPGDSRTTRRRSCSVNRPWALPWCLRSLIRLFCRQIRQRAAEADDLTTHRARSRAQWRRAYTPVENARWVCRFFGLSRDRVYGFPSPSVSDTFVITEQPSEDGSSSAFPRRSRRSLG
jgi:hypothetical protein